MTPLTGAGPGATVDTHGGAGTNV